MTFVHTLPPGHALGAHRDALPFGTADITPVVPKAGTGYTGIIDDIHNFSVLTPIRFDFPAWPADNTQILNPLGPTPYVVGFNFGTWVIIGWRPIGFVPGGSDGHGGWVATPGGTPWQNVFWWQLVARGPDGKLTVGPGHVDYDSAVQVTFDVGGYSGPAANLCQNNVAQDATFAYTGYGPTAYVRSVLFSFSSSKFGFGADSMSFVDFVLPAPWQTPLLPITSFPVPSGSSPNYRIGPPIVLSSSVGVVPVGAVYTDTSNPATLLSNPAILTFNPSTGAFIDKYTYSTPGAPMGDWLAVFRGAVEGMTGDVLIVALADAPSGIFDHVLILGLNSDGHIGRSFTYPSAVDLNNINWFQGSGTRFVGNGYITPAYNQATNSQCNAFFTLGSGAFQVNPNGLPALNGITGNYGGLTGPHSSFLLGNSNIWQQTVGPWDPSNSGVTTYTNYHWSAPSMAPTAITSTLNVPSATANPDGTRPATWPSPQGNTPALGAIGSYDSGLDMLWYTTPSTNVDTGAGEPWIAVW